MRKGIRVVDFKAQDREADRGTKKKYHFEIGFPKDSVSQAKVGKVKLNYSWHAQQEALSDRYGKIDLPVFLDTNRAKIIELETEGTKVVKVLYRTTLDTERDLVLAVIPGQWKVKTVWVNQKWDKHRTLDRSKYSYPYKP